MFGGARRNRTDDLFNAIEALSQLSYGPTFSTFRRCALQLGWSGVVCSGRLYNRKRRALDKARSSDFFRLAAAPLWTALTAPRRARCRRRSERLTSSSSSSSSSRKVSSAGPRRPRLRCRRRRRLGGLLLARLDLVERDQFDAGGRGGLLFLYLVLGAGALGARGAPWKTVPHLGQTIGSLFRSKNLAPQFWHWRLAPSSGFATAVISLIVGGCVSVAPVSRRRTALSMRFAGGCRQRRGGGCYEPLPDARRRGRRRAGIVSQTCLRIRLVRRPAALPAERSGPLKGARAAARRQIDLAPRLHLRPAEPRRDGDRGPARRRRRDAHRAKPARRSARASSGSARAAGASQGLGVGALLEPRDTLDFGNAGTGSRLMMGVVGGHGVTATFDGDASLRKRPMRRILDPLRADGRAGRSPRPRAAAARSSLRGADEPAPIVYRTPVASAQIKSAVLLAGLNARGATTVIESGSLARPHRKNARPFRRRGARRAGGRRPRASRSSAGPNCGRARSWCRPIRPRPPSRSSPR